MEIKFRIEIGNKYLKPIVYTEIFLIEEYDTNENGEVTLTFTNEQYGVFNNFIANIRPNVKTPIEYFIYLDNINPTKCRLFEINNNKLVFGKIGK